MKPKISIVMPVYNSEKYLQESIKSILYQTFKDFEFIIVDDCSTDGSLEIIKSYEDERIRLIQNEKNLGTVKSRNIGLKKAEGKYVAILDADDFSDNVRLKMQFDYLEKNHHLFLVGSSAVYVDEGGKVICKFRKYDDFRMLAWRLPKSCSIVHSSIMFRNTKELTYDEFYKSAHDYNFYLEALKQGKNLTNLPEFLTYHRVHDGASHSKSNIQRIYSLGTQVEHNYLNNGFGPLTKLVYSFRLGIFYLRTFWEKRERK